MDPTFRKILVSTDFSDLGNAAVPVAFGLAAAQGARVVLAHVLEGLELPTPLYAHYHPMPGPAEIERMEQKARGELQALVPEARRSVPHELAIARGSPLEELPRLAEDLHADLIVISSHGRRGVKRFLLGSVAERVVHRAPCSVMILRP